MKHRHSASLSRTAILLCILCCPLAVAGEVPPEPAHGPAMVGANRDAHGCIPSAGYLWCERESACVRPWEFAAEKDLASTPEAFERYCSGRAP